MENDVGQRDSRDAHEVRVGFGDVTLDAGAMELVRAGRRVPVEPQVLEVLIHLVVHRARVVPKTELLDEIWGDRFVSDSALSSRIKSARQAVGDNGRDQRVIRTIHGRGFRFVADVVDLDDRPEPSTTDDAPVADPETGAVAWSSLVAAVARGSGTPIELVGAGPTRREAVDDLLHLAESSGLLTCRGRGSSELRAYASVVEAIDELVSRWPDLLLELPGPCRAELEDVLGGGSPSSAQRLFVAAREVVAAGARAGGLVMAIEDVHLIDRATIELLDHIVRGVRRLPILLVATHRPGFELGPGFRVVELAATVQGTDDLPLEVSAALERVAVLGDEAALAAAWAATGLEPGAARRVIELAARAGVVDRDGDSLRFCDADAAERAAGRLGADERRDVHRRVADHLIEADADPGLVADHLTAAGDLRAAAPHRLRAAMQAAAAQRSDEVIAQTSDIPPGLDADLRRSLLELRADALSEVGDLEGVRCYRAALQLAGPSPDPWLRARLARAFLRANDVAQARDALEGIDLEDAAHPGVRLVGAMVHYLDGDLDRAERLVLGLRDVALAPGAPAELLDVITVQGMIAHSRGEWFDRLRMELRLLAGLDDLARTVFDAHVCVAQYLLYGPTGHADVIRQARQLRARAAELGAGQAMAFADTLEGEALLLSGDLDAARTCLERAVEQHRSSSGDTGLAHALQRLAEVHLHLGDRAESVRLLQQAIPLARWSPLSHHLLQRAYGTRVAAATTPDEASEVADDALATADAIESCDFCQVMVAVPAAIAYAGVGRLDDARAQLAVAARSAARWDGPAWTSAVTEAEGVLARAEGRDEAADALFQQAARGFDEAAQPLDAARCREAAT